MKKVCFIIAMAILVGLLPAVPPETRQGLAPGGAIMMRPGGPGGPSGPDLGAAMILRMKDKLDLTADQIKKMEAIQDEVKGKFKTGMETIQAKREAMQKLVDSNAPEAAIRTAAADVGKAIGDEAVLRAGTKTRVNAILTEAQRTKLKELREQRQEKWKEMREETAQKPAIGKNAEAMFKQIDTNNDGSVSLEEFKAHTAKMQERRGEKGPGGPGGRGGHGPRPMVDSNQPK